MLLNKFWSTNRWMDKHTEKGHVKSKIPSFSLYFVPVVWLCIIFHGPFFLQNFNVLIIALFTVLPNLERKTGLTENKSATSRCCWVGVRDNSQENGILCGWYFFSAIWDKHSDPEKQSALLNIFCKLTYFNTILAVRCSFYSRFLR